MAASTLVNTPPRCSWISLTNEMLCAWRRWWWTCLPACSPDLALVLSQGLFTIFVTCHVPPQCLSQTHLLLCRGSPVLGSACMVRSLQPLYSAVTILRTLCYVLPLPFTWAHIHAHVRTRAHTHTFKHVYKHTRMYMHAHARAHTHTHKHARKHARIEDARLSMRTC